MKRFVVAGEQYFYNENYNAHGKYFYRDDPQPSVAKSTPTTTTIAMAWLSDYVHNF